MLVEEKPLSMKYMRALKDLDPVNRNLVKDYYQRNKKTKGDVIMMEKAIKYAEQLKNLSQSPLFQEVQNLMQETTEPKTRNSLHARYSAAYRGLSITDRADVKAYYEALLKTYTPEKAKELTIGLAIQLRHHREDEAFGLDTTPKPPVIFDEEDHELKQLPIEVEKPVVVKSYCRALPGYGEDTKKEEASVIPHLFWLRPNLQIKVELPSDITPDETERLAKAIKTFVF